MPKKTGFLPPGWKKKWKKWNQQRQWIPGRYNGWPDKPDEKEVWNMRRKPFRQKPWNKPTRMEKFWTSAHQPDNDPSQVVTVGAANPGAAPPFTNAASYVYGLIGDQLATDPTSGAAPRALEHVKVHRLQGRLWTWLDPMTGIGTASAYNDGADGGNQPPSNIGMMMYVWMRLTQTANAEGILGLAELPPASSFNPNLLQDWAPLMVRDDIISWGTLPVFGCVPRMLQLIQQEKAIVAGTAAVPTQARAAYETFSNAPSLPGQFLQGRVTSIPLPKIPKAGLNLKKGQALVCVASMMNGGPGAYNSGALDDATVERPAVVTGIIRALCSL